MSLSKPKSTVYIFHERLHYSDGLLLVVTANETNSASYPQQDGKQVSAEGQCSATGG